MSQNQSPKGIGKFLTYAIIILALIVIIWNLYTGATIQEIGVPGFFTIKFGPKPTLTPTMAEPTLVQPTFPPTIAPTVPAQPTSEPISATEFVEQASYTGDCKLRPQGSICISYSDDYTWLVYDSLLGWDDGGDWQGKKIVVALGHHADYYHVLGTMLVKEVPKE
jgi:hypothetical protein